MNPIVTKSKSLYAAIILTGCAFFLHAGCSPPKPLISPAPAVPGPPEEHQAFDHSHAIFDRVLKTHVHKGLVDYRGISAESEAFNRYVTSLGAVNAASLNRWSRERQMAYWINAYNAFTIKAVIERYPIRERSLIGIFFPRNSILQISGIWDRLKFNAGGYVITLEQIEHQILRKEFDDPRIHFAIVCASSSCPVLRPEAYRSDVLEHQLHEQTFHFINDPARGVRWDPDRKRLYISKIFKWFKKDFNLKTASVGSFGGPGDRKSGLDNPVLDFIRPYVQNNTIRAVLTGNQDVRVSYLPYDWRLNDMVQTP